MGVKTKRFVVFTQRGPLARHGRKSMDAPVSPPDVPLALGAPAVDVAPTQQLDIAAWLLRHLA